jgi:TusA-related sulfurtransferase
VISIQVDSRGLRCPLPVIRLAQAALGAQAGTQVTLLATDPAARHDVPAWCRMRGHELREMSEIAEVTSRPASSATSSEGSDSSRTQAADPAGAQPAYLRFLVVVRAQPSKAEGTGNDSEHSSRTM